MNDLLQQKIIEIIQDIKKEDKKIRGLGDLISKVANPTKDLLEKVGFSLDNCGCVDRQLRANKLLSFGKKPRLINKWTSVLWSDSNPMNTYTSLYSILLAGFYPITIYCDDSCRIDGMENLFTYKSPCSYIDMIKDIYKTNPKTQAFFVGTSYLTDSCKKARFFLEHNFDPSEQKVLNLINRNSSILARDAYIFSSSALKKYSERYSLNSIEQKILPFSLFRCSKYPSHNFQNTYEDVIDGV